MPGIVLYHLKTVAILTKIENYPVTKIEYEMDKEDSDGALFRVARQTMLPRI